MKFTIKTTQLQELVSKAIKCASNDKLIPITNLMEIELKDNKLWLTTNDATNYFRTCIPTVGGDEFTVVVMADNFAKLVSKMTSENITFDYDGASFEISGGKSKYKLELPLDVDGQLVQMSIPYQDLDTDEETGRINGVTIDKIIDTAKASLATSIDSAIYTAYYLGDNVISTDSYKICCIANKVFDTPVLLSVSTMDILQLMSKEEEVSYYHKDDNLIFRTSSSVLYTKVFDGVESYPVDTIKEFISTDFENQCTLPKNELIQSLDRLSLFVGDYDRNVILIAFNGDSVTLKNKKSAGTETIDCLKSSGGKFECGIDIEMLKSQIKATMSDDVTIQYGLENCIKIVNDDVTQVVALHVE